MQEYNLIGQKYGTLTPTKLLVDQHRGRSRRRYLCTCTCGREKIVFPYNLTHNASLCVCQRKQMGLTASNRPFYIRWQNMMKRCYNPKAQHYRLYGKRGIRVCKRWHDFKVFYQDMHPTFKHGLTLDRINPDGNYSKQNCRWATTSEQCRNQRTNLWVEYMGERMILKDLARKLEIKPSTMYSRHRRGLPLFSTT